MSSRAHQWERSFMWIICLCATVCVDSSSKSSHLTLKMLTSHIFFPPKMLTSHLCWVTGVVRSSMELGQFITSTYPARIHSLKTLLKTYRIWSCLWFMMCFMYHTWFFCSCPRYHKYKNNQIPLKYEMQSIRSALLAHHLSSSIHHISP